MCGIFCRLGVIDNTVGATIDVQRCMCGDEDRNVLLDRRGPDFRSDVDLKSDCGDFVLISSSVLSLSPPFTPQPVVIANPLTRRICCVAFNGELYDIHELNSPSSDGCGPLSDTSVVATAASMSLCSVRGGPCPAAFASWLSDRRGEYSMVVTHGLSRDKVAPAHPTANGSVRRIELECSGEVWLARDPLGRRSLVWRAGRHAAPQNTASTTPGALTDGTNEASTASARTTTTTTATHEPHGALWIEVASSAPPCTCAAAGVCAGCGWHDVPPVGVIVIDVGCRTHNHASAAGTTSTTTVSATSTVHPTPPVRVHLFTPADERSKSQQLRDQTLIPNHTALPTSPPTCRCAPHPPTGTFILPSATLTSFSRMPIDTTFDALAVPPPSLPPALAHRAALLWSTTVHAAAVEAAVGRAVGGLVGSEEAVSGAVSGAAGSAPGDATTAGVAVVGLTTSSAGTSTPHGSRHRVTAAAVAHHAVTAAVPPRDVAAFGAALTRAVTRRVIHTTTAATTAGGVDGDGSSGSVDTNAPSDTGCGVAGTTASPQSDQASAPCREVGAFYSGGVDSSVVCALAAAILASAPHGSHGDATAAHGPAHSANDSSSNVSNDNTPPPLLFTASVAAGAPPSPPPSGVAPAAPACEDSTRAQVTAELAAFAVAPDRVTTLASWFDASPSCCAAPHSAGAPTYPCSTCGAPMDANLRVVGGGGGHPDGDSSRGHGGSAGGNNGARADDGTRPPGRAAHARLRGAVRVVVTANSSTGGAVDANTPPPPSATTPMAATGTTTATPSSTAPPSAALPLLPLPARVSLVCGPCLEAAVVAAPAVAAAAHAAAAARAVERQRAAARATKPWLTDGEWQEGVGGSKRAKGSKGGRRGAAAVADADTADAAGRVGDATGPATDAAASHADDGAVVGSRGATVTDTASQAPPQPDVPPTAHPTVAPPNSPMPPSDEPAAALLAALRGARRPRCSDVSPLLTAAIAAACAPRGSAPLAGLHDGDGGAGLAIAAASTTPPAPASGAATAIPPARRRFCDGSCVRVLVLVDVTLSAAVAAAAHVAQHMSPSVTVMDASIGTAISLATSAIAHVSPTTRVVLHGAGADELMGGYYRHARAAASALGHTGLANGDPRSLCDGNDPANSDLLADAVQLISSADGDSVDDVLRLWHRNLGRDDRIVGSYGVEMRTPFLDEDVVGTIWACAPSGHHEKRLLRQWADSIGLTREAREPKRAVQFGTRFADKHADAKANALETLRNGGSFLRIG